MEFVCYKVNSCTQVQVLRFHFLWTQHFCYHDHTSIYDDKTKHMPPLLCYMINNINNVRPFQTSSGLKKIKQFSKPCHSFILQRSVFPDNAAFRLACRSPHCRFDDDICTTAQAPLAAEAAEGWPSGKQRLANRSITLPLCPPRQIAGSWILFNSGAIPLGNKAKAAWTLRATTLKQQAMITRRSGELQASLKPALLFI